MTQSQLTRALLGLAVAWTPSPDQCGALTAVRPQAAGTGTGAGTGTVPVPVPDFGLRSAFIFTSL